MILLSNAGAMHLSPLISDLGLILMTAAVAVLIFKVLKQPLVLGYLIAGFLAGSHSNFFPSVTDIKNVEVWAEIGVAIFLFSLGLDFSFKKLMKVGGTASVSAVTQVTVMCVLGYVFGQWFGWSQMDSIFLGAILSISSTTIILKSFEELAVKTQKFAGNVIGSLIVQDIIAIVLMVLLSTLAVSNQIHGTELLFVVSKLVFFLALWFMGGIFIIPTFLKKAKPFLTDEILLIISLALCLMMVILASNIGFSPAFGAFIMGSILAETLQAERIEALIKPVKDLFGAVFFVSVGMMISPSALVSDIVPVLILSLLVIFGQSISAGLGALLSGQTLKDSVRTGMSLSQIGEFSFIIASLGISLKVTSSFLYPVIVAVSAVTVFCNPYMIKLSLPFSEYLENKMPKKWTKAIERYAANTQAIKEVNAWKTLFNAYLIQLILFSILIIAGILLSSKFLLPLIGTSFLGRVLVAVITLILVAPFIAALSYKRVAPKELAELTKNPKSRRPLAMLFLIRVSFSVFYIGLLVRVFFSSTVAIISLVLALIIYKIFKKRLIRQYHIIENHFFTNLNERETTENKPKINRSVSIPWDGHIATFEIAAASNITGKTLKKLQLREKFGVNIAYIKRIGITIYIPGASERIFPEDEIGVIGTDAQFEEFGKYLDQHEKDIAPDVVKPDIVLKQITLQNSEFCGKSIKESKLREITNGLVVGIEKKGSRILNPESEVIIEKEDIIWIVGDKKLLNKLL